MDKEFLEELFAPFGRVSVRKMFGGTGIFHRGLSIAGIMDGQFRLKADDQTIDDFVAEGMSPWEYQRKDGKIVTMNYWSVPERLLDDPESFRDWAQKAFEAAMRADAAKPLKQRKFKDV